jgi:iron complex outermembrane recepter protein
MKNGNNMLLCRAAAASVVVFCAAATAQESSDSSQLSEVVVTSQKRAENVQKVAASVSVIDSTNLEARGVVDLRGLSNLLPMAQMNMEGSTTQIFIRGIGQTSDVDTNSPGQEGF